MQATVYIGKQIVPNGDEFCNWLTPEIHEEECIKAESNSLVSVTKSGIVIKKQQNRTSLATTTHFIYGSDESVVWALDFKSIQGSKPQDSMVVLIQCSTLDELGTLKPIGYIVLNLFENFLKFAYIAFVTE